MYDIIGDDDLNKGILYLATAIIFGVLIILVPLLAVGEVGMGAGKNVFSGTTSSLNESIRQPGISLDLSKPRSDVTDFSVLIVGFAVATSVRIYLLNTEYQVETLLKGTFNNNC